MKRNRRLVNCLFALLQDKEMGIGEIAHELKEQGFSKRGYSFTRQQLACILAKNKLFVKSRKTNKVTLWTTNPKFELIEVKREEGGHVPQVWREKDVMD